MEGVVRCLRCGYTRRETYREWTPIGVPLILSHQETSERTILEISPKETVRVGDRFDLEVGTAEITAIEVKGRRVDETLAEEIDVLWSKRVDRVDVKFSLNKGGRTLSYSQEVPSDEEFEVGSLLELGKERCVIDRMKTKRGLVKEGRATADEIRRVYCKVIRSGRPGSGRGRSRR